MGEIPISLTCADYARIMPLATGEVKPEGIALAMILGSRGSWPARAEMLRRAVQDPGVQGGEWSMAQYLYRIDKGDRRYVGLPVFPLRNFTARDLYIRRGGSIRRPADLAGKRIGMYSYTASGSIWYRHFLRFVGLDPASIEWWIGNIDTPWSAPMDQPLPSGVNAPVKGRSLSDLLIAGELEAIYSPPRPAAYHPRTGPIVRLFPDFRYIEQEYFLVDRQAPHRGVRCRQRLLHRGTERVSVRHAVAGSRARGHRGRDGRGLPPVRTRAQPSADRGVCRRGVPAGPDEPPGHDRRVFRGLSPRRLIR